MSEDRTENDEKKQQHPAALLCRDPALRSGLFNMISDLICMTMCGIGIPFLFMLDYSNGVVLYAQLMVCVGTAQGIMSLIVGWLSDKYGERFDFPLFFLFSASLTMLTGILFILAASVDLMYVAGAVFGLSTASGIAIQKLIMLRYTQEEMLRVQPFVMVILSTIVLVGPNLGALLSAVDTKLPFWGALSAAGPVFITSLTIYLCNRKGSLRSGGIKAKEASSVSPSSNAKPLSGLFALGITANNFFFQLGDRSTSSMIPFFAFDRLGWSQIEVGIMATVTVVSTMLVFILIFSRLHRRFGTEIMLNVGLVMNIIGASLFARVYSTGDFILARAFDAIGTLFFNAALNILIEKLVNPNTQGKVISAVSVVNQLAMTAGPTLGSNVYIINKSFPWTLLKIPLSCVALFVNISVHMLAYW